MQKLTVSIRCHDANMNTKRDFRHERNAEAYVQDLLRNRRDILSISISDRERTECYSGRGEFMFTLMRRAEQ